MDIISNLIQRQIQRRRIYRRVLVAEKSKINPVICISRQSGSGGRLIAQLLCKKLKFEYYDRILINLIASNANLEKSIVKELDEQKENSLSAVIRILFGKEPYPEQKYIRSLSRSVLTIAEKGSSVILGRGANFIIPPQKRLAVRVIAPRHVRVKNDIQYEALSPEEARLRINRTDTMRRNYVKKYFSKKISSANHYDLLINTNYFQLEEAVDIIIKLYQELFRF